MAENIEEEDAENLGNPPSKNDTGVNAPLNEPETVNQNLEPETMEVHHHPHVEKKNFKEYFLEFLMIFLAVTMGFFAENIREHFAEKKITREYLETFKQQLERNKKIFYRFDSLYSSIIPLQDSAVNLFFKEKENDNLQVTSSLLMQISTEIAPSIDVSAYQQLINSGGLRYIHNIALKDTMSLYDGRIQYFENYNSNLNLSIAQFTSQIGSLQDVHDLISPEHLPEMMPYPVLTERERRMVITYYRISYIQSFGNKYLLKQLNDINESLLTMVESELNK